MQKDIDWQYEYERLLFIADQAVTCDEEGCARITGMAALRALLNGVNYGKTMIGVD